MNTTTLFGADYTEYLKLFTGMIEDKPITYKSKVYNPGCKVFRYLLAINRVQVLIKNVGLPSTPGTALALVSAQQLYPKPIIPLEFRSSKTNSEEFHTLVFKDVNNKLYAMEIKAPFESTDIRKVYNMPQYDRDVVSKLEPWAGNVRSLLHAL